MALTPTAYTRNAPVDKTTLTDPAQHADQWATEADQSMRRRLDAFGPIWFIDMLSVGYALEELAMAVRVRPLVLREWLRTQVPPDAIVEARQSAAAYYRMKAIRVLEDVTPTDPVELGHLKLKTNAYRDVAEAMDPGVWRPSPSSSQNLGVANVVINMTDPTALGGVKTIDYAEPTQQPAQDPTAYPAPPSIPIVPIEETGAQPQQQPELNLSQLLAQIGVDISLGDK